MYKEDLICHKTLPNQILYTWYKEDLALNNLQWLICHKIQPNLILYILYEEDLALNNLQWLICHKIQPNQILYILYKEDLALNNHMILRCEFVQNMEELIFCFYFCQIPFSSVFIIFFEEIAIKCTINIKVLSHLKK